MPLTLLDSRVSLIVSVITRAFLVATIVSWIVSRNPWDEKLSSATEVASKLGVLSGSLVNLNCLVPAVNLGKDRTLGSGIYKDPPKKPVISLTSLTSVIVASAPLLSPTRTILGSTNPWYPPVSTWLDNEAVSKFINVEVAE